jgi:hypothetical protein
MLGIDFDKLEDMVHRMEQVAASMDASSERVMQAAELLSETFPSNAAPVNPKNVELHTSIWLDGDKIHDAIKRFGEEGGDARR